VASLELIEVGREHSGVELVPAHRGVGVEAREVKWGTEVGAGEEVGWLVGTLEKAVRAVVFNVRAPAPMEQVRWLDGVAQPHVTIAPRTREAGRVHTTPGEDLA
jgi:hypothetical protein